MSSIAGLHHDPIFIVVMGVSGTGKSTLGHALASSLGYPYIEGDDLHSASSVAKMSAGIPLTDADREPWLALIRTTAESITLDHSPGEAAPKAGVVIGCSALRRCYRDILRGRRRRRVDVEEAVSSLLLPPPPSSRVLPVTCFVFIDGDEGVLRERMERRSGHFMRASMLQSQLETLESPVGEDDVVVVSLQDSTEEQVRKAVQGLGELVGRDIRS